MQFVPSKVIPNKFSKSFGAELAHALAAAKKMADRTAAGRMDAILDGDLRQNYVLNQMHEGRAYTYLVLEVEDMAVKASCASRKLFATASLWLL
jgi:hypothetical protein